LERQSVSGQPRLITLNNSSDFIEGENAVTSKATPYPKKELYSDKSLPALRGRNLLQVALPMGGIGAGCICLNGQGGLQDFSIRNAPAISAVADGHFPQDSAFAT
jgi:hypothetical protein